MNDISWNSSPWRIIDKRKHFSTDIFRRPKHRDERSVLIVVQRRWGGNYFINRLTGWEGAHFCVLEVCKNCFFFFLTEKIRIWLESIHAPFHSNIPIFTILQFLLVLVYFCISLFLLETFSQCHHMVYYLQYTTLGNIFFTPWV